MKVLDVRSPEFSRYGRIIEGYDFSGVISYLTKERYPDGVVYVASDPALEAMPVFQAFQTGFYGEMPAELGYCMGHNDRLNGLEYHRGSEVNISVTEYVVLVGLQQDLEEGFSYDTGKVEAFSVPAGLAVEFYATTLHYCALHLSPAGYAHATFLPAGTNTPLSETFAAQTPEDRLLTAKNKWFIAHPESGEGSGPQIALYGKNWTIADLEF